MNPDEITAKAREVTSGLLFTRSDHIPKHPDNEFAVNYTYTELVDIIATALRECAKEARREALTEAAAVADKYGWSQSAGERVSPYGEGALDIADAIASMIRRLKLKDTVTFDG